MEVVIHVAIWLVFFTKSILSVFAQLLEFNRWVKIQQHLGYAQKFLFSAKLLAHSLFYLGNKTYSFIIYIGEKNGRFLHPE